MVDLGDVGFIHFSYCLLKCSIEAADRRRRGVTGSRREEELRFAQCLVDCISPYDLPDIGDDPGDDADGDDSIGPDELERRNEQRSDDDSGSR